MKARTHKALAKRVRVTRTGKIVKRKAGQDHFNSRESGKTTRNKRRDVTFSPVFRRAVSELIPNA